MKVRYWKNYQHKIKKLSLRMVNYNKFNHFNLFEVEPYNHVRDILCLSLIQLSKRKKKIKILDYGSNILTLANLENKIELNKLYFTIYDPYYSQKIFSDSNIKKVQFNITNNLNSITKKDYDFINFGSSIQYELNIFKKLNKLKINKAKFILITHTPISLSKKYSSPQTNIEAIQHIHSYRSIINYFKKKRFTLIFKSRIHDKFIACKFVKKQTHCMNLLFLNEKNNS